MATTKPKLLTADDLLRLYSQGVNGELIRGVLCKTMPRGRRHGRIQAKLIIRLGAFVESRKLGFVVGETGVRLEQDPDTVRAPDIAYSSYERVSQQETEADDGHSEAVPDFAVEVVSPNGYSPCGVRQGPDVASERGTAGVGGVPRHPHR